MAQSIKEVLGSNFKGPFPETCLLQGENPFLEERLRLKLKALGAEIKHFQVPKTGLSSEMIEATQGGLLFSPLVAVILEFSASTSSWSASALRNLEEVLGRANPNELLLIFQVPNDKRLKWDGLKCKIKIPLDEESFEDRVHWLEVLNQEAGGILTKEKIEFLASEEDDLLGLKNAIELWTLGGDAWAKDNLSWTLSSSGASSSSIQSSSWNAFDWVDLVFGKKHKEAQLALSQLFGQGEDPFKLLGLIGKSGRLAAMLELKKNTSGQAPFLIQKLKKIRSSPALLLKLAKEADLFMKSSSVNAKAMLQRLRL